MPPGADTCACRSGTGSAGRRRSRSARTLLAARCARPNTARPPSPRSPTYRSWQQDPALAQYRPLHKLGEVRRGSAHTNAEDSRQLDWQLAAQTDSKLTQAQSALVALCYPARSTRCLCPCAMHPGWLLRGVPRREPGHRQAGAAAAPARLAECTQAPHPLTHAAACNRVQPHASRMHPHAGACLA